MTNLFNPRSHFGKKINPSRREFLKQSAALAITIAGTSCLPLSEQTLTDKSDHTFSQNPLDQSKIVTNLIKFNGERQDPITGHYHLGNGARMYNTSLMRFHAMDSMSPFGKGGINSYAYCLGDPINQRDPSGHFAITSLLIGMIVGAVIGASLSALAEGINVAVTGQQFDWKQVAIGAALGAIGGGFGAASQGAAFGAKLGLAFGDATLSGMADFMMNSAAGMPAGEAAKNAGIGAVIGLVSFGINSLGSLADDSIAFGGQMTNSSIGPAGLFYYQDMYHGKSRLNIIAHGSGSVNQIKDGLNRTLTAADVAKIMSRKYNMDTIESIRTISCYSAKGGEYSFGGQLSQILGKSVKSYEGPVSATGGQLGKYMLEQLNLGVKTTDIQAVIASISPVVSVVKKNIYNPVLNFNKWKNFSYKPVYFSV